MKIKVSASSSSSNCYLMQSGGVTFLLDCGIKKNELIAKLAQEKLTIADLEFCLISHEHNDHSALADYLSNFMSVYSCYNSEFVKKIDSNKLLKLGNIRIIPFNVKHGKTENYGYIINDGLDNLLFATDCNLIEYNFYLKKVDKMICPKLIWFGFFAFIGFDSILIYLFIGVKIRLSRRLYAFPTFCNRESYSSLWS